MLRYKYVETYILAALMHRILILQAVLLETFLGLISSYYRMVLNQ